MVSFGDIELVKEFSPEQAGKRVGWSSIVEVLRENTEPYYIGNIVVSTIDDDGAKLGYHVREEDGEIRYAFSSDCAEGFLDVSSLSVAIIKGQDITLGGGSLQFRNGDHDSLMGVAGILLNGVGFNRDHLLSEKSKKWGDSPSEVILGLKNGLQEVELTDYYPSIYYLLNSFLGHEHYSPISSARAQRREELFLPDPDQHQDTLSQLEVAGGIVSKLEGITGEDDLMKGALLDNSDAIPLNVADIFTESRRQVSKREREILNALCSLSASGLIYLPTGFRPNGRSWPYMDALESTEDRAFGPELATLRGGSTSRVEGELERELRELQYRVKYAKQGQLALKLLAKAEEQST